MAQVTHEEIETAFSVAIKCDHCKDADNTCWDCTVKMFNIEYEQAKRAEAAEARAAQLEAERDEAQAEASELLQTVQELRDSNNEWRDKAALERICERQAREIAELAALVRIK